MPVKFLHQTFSQSRLQLDAVVWISWFHPRLRFNEFEREGVDTVLQTARLSRLLLSHDLVVILQGC